MKEYIAIEHETEDTVTVVHKTPEHCWFFASQKDPQYCSMGRKKEDG